MSAVHGNAAKMSLAAVFACLWGIACSQDGQISLSQSQVLLSGTVGAQISQSAADAALSAELSAAGSPFVVRTKSSNKLVVDILEAVPSTPQRPGRVRVYSTIGESEVIFRGQGIATGEAAMLALLQNAIATSLKDVHLAAQLSERPTGELVSMVNADTSRSLQENPQLIQAIRVLGHRKESSAVPVLLPLLKSGRSDVSAEAVLALAQMGDSGAIMPIIEFADGKPAADRKLAIRAVESIGSPVGEPWLFTMSTGHPDTGVQLEAKRALMALAKTAAE